MRLLKLWENVESNQHTGNHETVATKTVRKLFGAASKMQQWKSRKATYRENVETTQRRDSISIGSSFSFGAAEVATPMTFEILPVTNCDDEHPHSVDSFWVFWVETTGVRVFSVDNALHNFFVPAGCHLTPAKLAKESRHQIKR